MLNIAVFVGFLPVNRILDAKTGLWFGKYPSKCILDWPLPYKENHGQAVGERSWVARVVFDGNS